MKKLFLLFVFILFGLTFDGSNIYANSNQKLSVFMNQFSEKVLSIMVYDVVYIKKIQSDFRWIDIKGTSLNANQVQFIRFYIKDEELVDTYKGTISYFIEANLKQLKFKKNKNNSIKKNAIQHYGWERGNIRCIVDVPNVSNSLEGGPEGSENNYVVVDFSCVDVSVLENAKKTQTVIVNSLRNAGQTPKEDTKDQHVFVSQVKNIGDFIQFNYGFWEYGGFAGTAVKFGSKYIFLGEGFPISCSKLKDYTRVKGYSKMVNQGLCVN